VPQTGPSGQFQPPDRSSAFPSMSPTPLRPAGTTASATACVWNRIARFRPIVSGVPSPSTSSVTFRSVLTYRIAEAFSRSPAWAVTAKLGYVPRTWTIQTFTVAYQYPGTGATGSPASTASNASPASRLRARASPASLARVTPFDSAYSTTRLRVETVSFTAVFGTETRSVAVCSRSQTRRRSAIRSRSTPESPSRWPATSAIRSA
jgi:hypothetical protein